MALKITCWLVYLLCVILIDYIAWYQVIHTRTILRVMKIVVYASRRVFLFVGSRSYLLSSVLADIESILMFHLSKNNPILTRLMDCSPDNCERNCLCELIRIFPCRSLPLGLIWHDIRDNHKIVGICRHPWNQNTCRHPCISCSLIIHTFSFVLTVGKSIFLILF